MSAHSTEVLELVADYVFVRSRGSSYSAVNAGTSGDLAASFGGPIAGDAVFSSLYYLYETFTSFKFDRADIPPGSVILDVTLEVYASSLSATSSFTLEAFKYDFAMPVTTAAWRTGAQLGTMLTNFDRVATLASGSISAGAYNTMSESGLLLRQAVQTHVRSAWTGNFKLVLAIDKIRLSSAPTSGADRRYFNTSGPQPARLTVVYSPPALNLGVPM